MGLLFKVNNIVEINNYYFKWNRLTTIQKFSRYGTLSHYILENNIISDFV